MLVDVIRGLEVVLNQSVASLWNLRLLEIIFPSRIISMFIHPLFQGSPKMESGHSTVCRSKISKVVQVLQMLSHGLPTGIMAMYWQLCICRCQGYVQFILYPLQIPVLDMHTTTTEFFSLYCKIFSISILYPNINLCTSICSTSNI